MEFEGIKEKYEFLAGEGLKMVAEKTLDVMGKSALGREIIQFASYDEGLWADDPRLECEAAGVEFRNPLTVGAGWDKKGRCVDGLFAVGFAGVEVGTVLVHPQAGDRRPRVFTIDDRHSVGLNRLAFNSIGELGVKDELDQTQTKRAAVGISLGKNKLTPDSQAAEAHAQVAQYFVDYGEWFVVNVSSPGTPGLIDLLKKEPLTDITCAVIEKVAPKPVLIKVSPDMTIPALEDVIEVALSTGAAGLVIANTSINEQIKRKYGVGGQSGGISGADPTYRTMTTEMLTHTYELVGDELDIIGVGAINSGLAAADKLLGGASSLQVVTAIREHGPKVANKINRELLEIMEVNGFKTVKEMVGAATKRGTKKYE